MTRTVVFTVLAVWGVALGAGLRAHHSGSEYDRRTIEIEGRLVEVAWQNPHVHFLVRTTDPSGKPVIWDIEANSLSIMRRTDATPETLKVGDVIKVAGTPSRQNPTRMWAMNILAANGREIVLGPGIQPRWTYDGRRLEVHLVRRRHGGRQERGHFPRVEHEVRRTRGIVAA